MPFYNNSAFGPPLKTITRIGTQTQPNYLFGSFNFDTQPFLFSVSQVALTTNVATLTVQLVSGGGPSPLVAPSVGAKMGVRGTQTNAGAFNVDPAIVTAVNLNASGAGTISFALTHANVATTPDVGQLVVQPYETPDLVSQGSASQALALIFTPDESDNSRCLFAEAKWTGTMPTSATVNLQVANIDDDSRFSSVGGALSTVSASAVTLAAAQYNFTLAKFIRAKITAMTGGDATTGLIVTVFA